VALLVARPARSNRAVAALEALTRKLAEDGWLVTGRSRRDLVRPRALASREPEEERVPWFDDRAETEAHREPAVPADAHLDSALLTQLRSELDDARQATELIKARGRDSPLSL